MAEPTTEHEPPLKWPLAGAALFIVLTLAMVIATRIGTATDGTPVAVTRAAAPALVRELRFEDRNDGGIDVIDGATGRVVEVLEPGEHGFIRGVLRALSRDRMLRNLGSGPTFLVSQGNDGVVSIQDTATRHTIALNGFGQTNAGAFVRLLKSNEVGK